MSDPFTTLVRTAKRKLAARRDYAALLKADDWLLKDIGISRSEAMQRRVAASRFWRA